MRKRRACDACHSRKVGDDDSKHFRLLAANPVICWGIID
jgi:hypothetical protein